MKFAALTGLSMTIHRDSSGSPSDFSRADPSSLITLLTLAFSTTLWVNIATGACAWGWNACPSGCLSWWGCQTGVCWDISELLAELLASVLLHWRKSPLHHQNSITSPQVNDPAQSRFTFCAYWSFSRSLACFDYPVRLKMKAYHQNATRHLIASVQLSFLHLLHRSEVRRKD